MSRRIAILTTSSHSDILYTPHKRESEQIARRLQTYANSWQFDAFDVFDNEFPQDLGRFDGVVISGSPSSVNQNETWILRTLDFIAELYLVKKPMFGICFGHQAIARALGADVVANPGGWSLGAVSVRFKNHAAWMQPAHSKLTLYAVHNEQVKNLPDNAVAIAETDTCPIAGFRIGDHVMTTQHHPEMTRQALERILAVLAEEPLLHVQSRTLGDAQASLALETGEDSMIRWINGFFDQR